MRTVRIVENQGIVRDKDLNDDILKVKELSIKISFPGHQLVFTPI